MSLLYLIPSTPIEHCHAVKKSKFITRIHHVEDRDAAMLHLNQAKSDYPDARHHCWAYLLGSPSQPKSQAFNDDGEPSGTAGKPILNVLNHGVVGDIMVIVIRYFGGIKLGAGGLVRAYSNATQQTLDILDTDKKIALLQARLNMPFALENKCRHFLKIHQGHVHQQEYTNDLAMLIDLPIAQKSALIEFCLGFSIQITRLDD
ncbi:MAG: YigZ family protein [Pseudomonadales bacterium]|nr:YigZ family protein [Pseudomonadales bacterium]